MADRPAGPSDPSSHSDAAPRGDATAGSGGIVVVANGDVVTEDGNDDSVPMEKITRVSHVEVPPEVTWVDKKNHLKVIYFFQYGRVQRNLGSFMNIVYNGLKSSNFEVGEVNWMGG